MSLYKKFGLWAGLTFSAIAGSAVPPNVIVILADDQGWGDVSWNGNKNLRTPHLDSLARDGAVLERFYVSPVCAPTRAEFLTGRYHTRLGRPVVSTDRARLNLEEKTIGDAFRAAGYATGVFGKWHNGSQWPYHPNARGFEEFYGFTAGYSPEYYDPPLEHNGRFVRGRGYIADDFAEHALTFITEHRATPFFCYLAFNTPHDPYCVPDEYWNRFKADPIAQRGPEGADEDVAVTRSALAMCENLDWNVGRVLQKLDELELRQNTIVLFFSDNGPKAWRWNGGMKGKKGSTDEGGVRSPCFIRWPAKIAPGTQVREIAAAIDLLPTLASLAGIAPSGTRPLDGRDVSPLLLRAAGDWPDRILFSHQHGRISARSRQYRLDHLGALFDMVTDPGQQTDIQKTRPEIARRMQQAVAGWRRETLGESGVPGAKSVGTEAGRAADVAGGEDWPFPVGFAEFPTTPLPARDGAAYGNIRRSSRSVNGSYFVNWSTIADAMTWDIEVRQPGKYEVVLYYTCSAADAGSTVEMSFKSNRMIGKVTEAWDPPVIDSRDRVPRDGLSPMKDFRPLHLGTIQLESGRDLLRLRALKIPGRQVADVLLVSLTLI